LTATGSDDRAALRWLLSFVRPRARRLAAVLALALLGTGLALVQPLLTRLLIDGGILAGDLEIVLLTCGLMLLAALTSALIGGVNRYQHVGLSADVLFALRLAVFRHLADLPPTFYARRPTGDLLARLDGDVAEIQRFAVDGLLGAISAVIGLVGTLALMLLLSWQLSLIAFVLLPAELAFLRLMRPRVEVATRHLRERAGELSSFLVERLGAIKLIQSVAAEEREAGSLDSLQGHFRRDLLSQQMISYVTGGVPALLTQASTALVFIVGGWMVIEGRLTLGTLIAFAAYLGRVAGPVQTLLGLYLAAQRALVSLRRVVELTAERPAVKAPALPCALPANGRGEVRLEGVRFGYRDDAVLRGIDLVVRPGEKLGIVGLSGAGKSTLIDLLLRHHDPQAGRILLDGVDLRDLELAALRRAVAVVAQDVVLFRGSLLENLRYAAPDASEAQVLDAARRAEVDAFARSLPEGYASEVGTSGATLSAGQRQRIAIARALLQDPRVLVLDEATSAIDEVTEARIVGAIDELFSGRTRIVISHRKATLAGAPRLIALEAGRLVERSRMPAAP
jgi:ATP-binding cassette, subfamily B, bacterial